MNRDHKQRLLAAAVAVASSATAAHVEALQALRVVTARCGWAVMAAARRADAAHGEAIAALEAVTVLCESVAGVRAGREAVS